MIAHPNDPIVVTIADKQANYILTEHSQIIGAWSGPFHPGLDYWLYWDINVLTGAITRGHTTFQPIYGHDDPLAHKDPLIDMDGQHWFNLNTNETNVWHKTGWIRKIRVFAAKLSQGVTFTSVSINSQSFLGTQIGSITVDQLAAGSILYDTISGYGIKRTNGTFLTTEDSISTGISSSSVVKIGGIVIEAIANANIPAYCMVRFCDHNTIEVANNYLIDNGAYGIVDKSCGIGEVAQIMMEGIVQNVLWDWSHYPVNTPLYVDFAGVLTPTIPPTPVIVAIVIDMHTILLRPSSLYVNMTNDPASVTNMGSVLLSIQPDDITTPIAVGDNDPRILSVMGHIDDDAVHYSPNMDIQVNNIVANSYSNMIVELPNIHPDVEWNMNQGSVANLLVVRAITILNPLNIPATAIIILKIQQDSIGNHIISFDTNFKLSADGIVSLLPNSTSIFTFISDGVYLYEMSHTIGVL
jgi:hypothetical protein